MSQNESVLYKKLESIVGLENITDKELVMEAYTASTTGKFSRGRQEMSENVEKPGFVVRAGSTEEVQEIVRLANEYKVPIIPLGAMTSAYSETIPSEGCIMLDMSRMKNIELDEDIMTVTLEPGVTWAQAYRELTMKGYWISNQALPASVSILGTTSQAGSHMPFDKYPVFGGSYYSTATIGLEVVLPTGELLVSGSAALPGAKPEHERAYGPGVGHIFLAAAGTLGVVVKQTLPLWRIPEVRFIVTGLFTHENFEGLSNAMYKIMYDILSGGPIWAERISAFYDATKRPEWELYVDIYGSKEIVEALRKFSERIIIEEGGKLITNPRIFEPENTESPQMYEEYIFWRPRANSINMPILNVARMGIGCETHYQKIPELYDAMLNLLAKHGIPISRIRRGSASPPRRRNAAIQSMSLMYYYNPNDPEEVKKANVINEEWPQIYTQITGEKLVLSSLSTLPVQYRLTPTMAKNGMPMLGEYYNLLVKLKRMLDPNRVMNPGKLMDIEPY